MLALAVPVMAQTAEPPTEKSESPRTRAATFLAGGAAGLVAHEAGHILAAAALDANPGFRRLDGAIIPFFSVTHDSVSPRAEFVISSSGFFVQHAVNEWLLADSATLRHRQAPFRKGWLTFNLATSAVYAVTAFARAGPVERDTRGMALGADVSEPLVGVMILTPAVLDGLRYLRGDPAWARWSSRAAKVGLVLLAVR